jgi:hypothetical protein
MSETNSNLAAQDGSSATSSLAGRSSRGRGRGGRGRGHGSRSRSGRSSATASRSSTTTFKGNTDGMKGNVFYCHGENTNKQQFLGTVGVLEEHINKTFTYQQDVATVCKSFEIMPLIQPANLAKTEYKEDMGKKVIWETSMTTLLKCMDLLESNTRGI